VINGRRESLNGEFDALAPGFLLGGSLEQSAGQGCTASCGTPSKLVILESLDDTVNVALGSSE
jgi:hypothetical protein